MKERLRILPYPVSGLMLALLSLGNLLNGISPIFRYVLGALGFGIFIALLIKMLLFPKSLKEAFDNPVVASVMATFPMGLVVLSTYITQFIDVIGFMMWVLGTCLNLVLVVLFTKKHVIPFNIKKVFPSYFVLYVGVAIASLTAPIYDMQSIGRVIFWYGLVVYVILIPLVSYRVFVVRNLLEPIKPTLIIYSAPASLLLVGYLNSFTDKNVWIVYLLGVWAFLMMLFGLYQLPKLLKTSFYPSWSSFTFPFVISAIAFNSLSSHCDNNSSILYYTQWFLTLWATLIVGFVLVKYTLFLKSFST